MTATASKPTREQRFRCALVGVVPSVVMLGVAVSLLSAWRGDLPDPMASHWGTGGVDGTSSIAGAIVTVVVVCVLAAALNTVASLAMSHPRQVRASVALINFLVVAIAGVIPAVAAGQRGVAAVHDVATPVVPILLTLAIAAVVAAASWVLIPQWATAVGGPVGAVPAEDLASGERFYWQRSVGNSVVADVLLAATAVVLGIITAVTGVWWLLVVPALIVLGAVLMGTVRVRIDRSAMTVRGALPWPRQEIAMADIVRAEVITVHALRDTGGYGRRLAIRGEGKGAWGFVVRSGEAVMVTRTDGRRDFVVVDDAATAAGLINAVLAQRLPG
ncbi:hypothetical protein GPOL_c30030 [Gordonia polyisoprenivorans VH2]|uniref:DUF1648 domain-containing protein n=1 Tax=Gordonia polyisoprenivorans (strain DSM 44266 / VH2) TaxID=1112204 RepID=H6MUN4_GORPV|nr:hypothetical protein [Gordonia polyisoprenivorans]AFA74018.1 hypothetical protein GPOL_c30030 [Gordonia polyisoprenivorans VH2]QUD84475.1 hypothetical protein J8M97_07730 [Gordonia polyisoprenivorans]UZF54436.1 hypothetical protein LH935_16995 [Gordonia polyisoprenivorans]